MIDGLKLEILNFNGEHWLNNNLLNFETPIDISTAELTGNRFVANYKGLRFTIIKSLVHDSLNYYLIQGSVHKFLNDGQNNYTDFTFTQLQHVVKELEDRFMISPEKAYIRSLEFGVNIHVPVMVDEVLKSLVSHKNKTFSTFNIEQRDVGKVLNQQSAKLKVYNKGLQYDLPDDNLLRVEVSVKKMVYLKQYGIRTLADLTDIAKIKPLGNLLLSWWQDIIYYDKKIKWKQATNWERKKLLYYAAPRNWQEFDRKQRFRAKIKFNELLAKYSTSTTHTEISNLIIKKWNDLADENCPRFNHDDKLNGSSYLSTNYPLEYRVKMYPKNPLNKICHKDKKQKRFCKTCKTSIDHKKSNAIYCSKKCANIQGAKLKKLQRANQKKTELKVLDRFLRILSKGQTIELRKIKARVSTIIIVERNKLTTLTSYRARKLLKEYKKGTVNNY